MQAAEDADPAAADTALARPAWTGGTDDDALRSRRSSPIAAGVPTDFEGPSIAAPDDGPHAPAADSYLRLLLLLLVSAAFFEGYDSSILALLLPNIQSSFGVSEATLGLTRIPIELGLFVAFFVARLSDRLGRRPMLLWSVVGLHGLHRARPRSAGTSGRSPSSSSPAACSSGPSTPSASR